MFLAVTCDATYATSRVEFFDSGSSEEQWDVDKEIIEWELGDLLVLLPLVLSVEEIWNNDLDEKDVCWNL